MQFLLLVLLLLLLFWLLLLLLITSSHIRRAAPRCRCSLCHVLMLFRFQLEGCSESMNLTESMNVMHSFSLKLQGQKIPRSTEKEVKIGKVKRREK